MLVRDAASGEVLLERSPEVRLSTASVPKLLLLIACAAAIEAGELDPGELLDRGSVPSVGDSGLWQHLGQQALSVADAAALVGAVSDNLATNVLLARIGLEAVSREAARLGIRDVHLHDAVRDARGPTHPPRLSSASAAGLVDMLTRLSAGELGSAAVSERVLGWMRHSVDLSMVASAFGQDPLAHGGDAPQLFVKTGTDAGVRADAGVVRAADRTLVYAAIANWPADVDATGEVLASMRGIGELVRAAVEGDRG
ncbi:serine hydrolase [Agrococcus baldri]|uniref:Serine hydrolase n=1 Tax=Agrococcus baldri TaxID=153730 RepID=A0AA87REV7_9MICO|nr:serine hydrolase [Agrococcus baldri]GEK79195.1 serine hydrolase [Agrococcus baldri]